MGELTTNKRKNEISYLNILFCVIVIFIHACSDPVKQYQAYSLPYYLTQSLYRLSTFVVQGFIFLSGVKLFLNLKEPHDYVGMWLKQFKRIVLPYVLWVCIYYGYYVSIGWDSFALKPLFKHVLVGDYQAHFYFVIIIVQFYLLAPALVALVKKLHPAVLLTVSFALMIFLWQFLPQMLNEVLALSDIELINYPIRVYLKYIDRVFTSYLLYFVLGLIVGRFYDPFMEWLRGHGWYAVLAFVVFAAGDLCCYLYVGYYWYRFMEIYHVFYCISAIVFLLYLSDIASRRLVKDPPSFVKAADGATYLVYLMHLLVQFLVKDKLAQYGVTSVSLRFAGSFVLTVIISFACAMLWQFVCKKYNERLNKKAS